MARRRNWSWPQRCLHWFPCCGQQAKARNNLYEPLLEENERQAAAELLHYLEQCDHVDFFRGEPLRAVCSLVYSENVDLQRSVSAVLAEVTERRPPPLPQEALPPLLYLLHVDDTDVRLAAIAALGNLAAVPANKALIVRCSGLEALVAVASASRSTLVQCNAVGCLTNLSTLPANKLVIARSAALPLLLRSARSRDARVARNATGALLNLTQTAQDRAHLVQSGVLPVLVALHDASDVTTRFYAVAALANIASDSSARRRLAAAASQLAPSLVAAATAPTSELRRQALLTMRNFSVEPAFQTELVHHGALPVLLGQLGRLPSADDALVAAAACLRNLSVTSENERPMVDAGVLAAAIDTLHRLVLGASPIQHVEALCHTVALLRNLAVREAHTALVAQSTAVEDLAVLLCLLSRSQSLPGNAAPASALPRANPPLATEPPDQRPARPPWSPLRHSTSPGAHLLGNDSIGDRSNTQLAAAATSAEIFSGPELVLKAEHRLGESRVSAASVAETIPSVRLGSSPTVSTAFLTVAQSPDRGAERSPRSQATLRRSILEPTAIALSAATPPTNPPNDSQDAAPAIDADALLAQVVGCAAALSLGRRQAKERVAQRLLAPIIAVAADAAAPNPARGDAVFLFANLAGEPVAVAVLLQHWGKVAVALEYALGPQAPRTLAHAALCALSQILAVDGPQNASALAAQTPALFALVESKRAELFAQHCAIHGVEPPADDRPIGHRHSLSQPVQNLARPSASRPPVRAAGAGRTSLPVLQRPTHVRSQSHGASDTMRPRPSERAHPARSAIDVGGAASSSGPAASVDARDALLALEMTRLCAEVLSALGR